MPREATMNHSYRVKKRAYLAPSRVQRRLFDEPPLLCVRHCLEAIVCAELAVDVMEVVAECLAGDAQSARNDRRVAAVREELENATLLLGKRFYGRVLGRVTSQPNESLSHLHHLVEQLLLAAALADVVRQTDKEPPARPMIVEDDRRNVHPDAPSISHPYVEVEILDTRGHALGTASPGVDAAGERPGT